MKKMLIATFVLLSAFAVHAQDAVQSVPAPYITHAMLALTPLEVCQVDAHQQKSAVLALQVENAQLRAQLADAQARLDGPALTTQRDALLKERADLEKTLVKTLGGADGDAIDWSKSPVVLVKKETK